MGVAGFCMTRAVRFIIAFLVFDLLIYSAFVLHPSYAGYIGSIIPFPPQESYYSLEQSFEPTSTISSSLPAHSSPSEAAEEHSSHTIATSISVEKPTSIKTSLATIPLNSTNKWAFDTSRDSAEWSLSSDRCDISFLGLFKEIDRAVNFQTIKGKVTPNDIDISWKKDGAVRAQIINQKLYILEAKIHNDHSRMRSVALLSAINRAIVTSPEPIPDIEFSFITSDIADEEHRKRTVWALTRLPAEEETWVMSDFGYWSWAVELLGGYEDVRNRIAALETDFELKKKRVVWRGTIRTNPNRKLLLKEVEGKEWADVESVDWRDARRVKSIGAISIPEHCKYQFVLQTEGRSYSGRLKYLQNCNSVVIIPKRNWIEPHHNLLVSSGPEQNFVEIREDFLDLESNILALLDDPKKAKRIAEKSVQTFRDRVLTPAAQNCYWRKLLGGWSEVSFVPEKSSRGVPFESFVVQEAMAKPCTWWSKIILKC